MARVVQGTEASEKERSLPARNQLLPSSLLQAREGEHLSSIRIPPRIVDGDFAGWLREAMAARRLSARVVAMRTGIDHSTITRLLQGVRKPTLTTAVALLQLLESEALDVAD